MTRSTGRTIEMDSATNGGTKRTTRSRRANGEAAPTKTTQKPFVEGGRISSGDKHLEWISVEQMRISPRAQRKHDSKSSRAKIEDIANNFDPDKFGTLTVNLRDDIYWIIDGGHRYLGVILMGWGNQKLQCWTYHGLSEAEEADKFLALNDVKAVSGMDKFLRAIVAGYEVETDINRIVQAADLSIGTQRESIGCISAITKTYTAGGPKVLATTLRLIRDAYGHAGFSSKVTEGMGMFVASYENVFDEELLLHRLSGKKGGVNGLVEEAQLIRMKYGVSLATAVAAAIVETYNRGRGGKHLAGWWARFAS